MLWPYRTITLDWPRHGIIARSNLDVLRNDQLLAIPFFTLMGVILERSGMAEDLLETVRAVVRFGAWRLAYAVILVGAVLAAITGTVLRPQ